MHLVARCLAFIMAKFDMQLVASHIKGAENSLADALSRDNLRSLPSGRPRTDTHTRSSARPSPSLQARLDIWALDRAVEFYFLNGLSASTRKAYDAAKKRYRGFCADKGVQPLPTLESHLCQFVSHLRS